MKVYFFTVHLPEKMDSVDSLTAAFGPNIPKPMMWEGGSGGYLFCLARPIDEILAICKSLGCTISSTLLDEEFPELFRRQAFTIVEVYDEKYNGGWTACVQYFQKDYYVLTATGERREQIQHNLLTQHGPE